MAKPANGNGLQMVPPENSPAEPKSYSVGSTLQIGGDDGETIKTAQLAADRIAMVLGAKRVEFLTYEQQAAQALLKAQQDYRATIETIAKKRGLNIGPGSSEQWNWDPGTLTFTRVR